MIIINIDKEDLAKKRIDIALSELTEFSRSMIQKMIHAEKITCNDEIVKKANFVTEIGQIYKIQKQESNLTTIFPEKGNLNILFEDEHIIVLNKDAEVVVHPGAGNKNGTLINHLANYFLSNLKTEVDLNLILSDLNGEERLGVVHRLDKGVSGCIIFAKTNAAHINLNKQFQERTIQKKYLAFCYGQIIPAAGIMEDHIARSKTDRKKMQCYKDKIISKRKYQEEDDIAGKHALMKYRLKKSYNLGKHNGFISLIECFPETGRMHQIRVQLASRGVPIAGDNVYGHSTIFAASKRILELENIISPRIALHAESIAFIHPISKEEVIMNAPLPKEFLNIENWLIQNVSGVIA